MDSIILDAPSRSDARVNLKTIRPHARNANKGSERGDFQVEHSLKKLGAGRSIVVDKNGVVIAGNHVLEKAQELGLQGMIVETDGRTLVIVKRKDLDLDSSDKKALELAYADNLVAKNNLAWDAEMVEADIADGLDLSKYAREDELAAMMGEEEERGEKNGQGGLGMEHIVKLLLTETEYNEFSTLTRELAEQWGMEAAAPVVLEALRRAARGGTTPA